MHCHLDHPVAGALCDPLCFLVEGWLNAGERQGSIECVEVHADGRLLGRTATLGLREDVTLALHLPSATRTGFQVFCHYENRPPRHDLPLEVRVRFRGEPGDAIIARSHIALVAHDYRTADYGHTLDAAYRSLIHREHVYSSGPSLAEGSPACLALVQKFLGPPPLRLLDVGCGLGYYGRHLRVAGYDWTGAEIKPADCAELARQGLPFRQVDGRTLPFADGVFDAALCIEVIEHAENLGALLAEVRRVAPRIFVSVPNFEPVAYLGRWSVVPWHLLEGDHKNFFTRWSLEYEIRRFFPQVEVGCYHEMPLRTREGTPLYNSLFAYASAI